MESVKSRAPDIENPALPTLKVLRRSWALVRCLENRDGVRKYGGVSLPFRYIGIILGGYAGPHGDHMEAALRNFHIIGLFDYLICRDPEKGACVMRVHHRGVKDPRNPEAV